MSNAGDDNLESDVRVKLKLDSTQIRDDLRTVRELITATFEAEDFEQDIEDAPRERGRWRADTEERLRRQQASAMNIRDTSVSTVQEVVEQSLATLRSAAGSHPYNIRTEGGRRIEKGLEIILSGESERFRNLLPQIFNEAKDPVIRPLRTLHKDLPVRQTSQDQLIGWERVSGELIAGMGRGEMGAGPAGFEMTAMHAGLQNVIKDLAESIGKTADLEVRIDPASRRRADIFMSNFLEGIGKQFIAGEIKTGTVGTKDMNQMIGYLKQSVRRYETETGGLPGQGQFKGFMTAPSYAKGAGAAFQHQWAGFMNELRGEGKDPSQYLQDPSVWMSFVETQGLSDDIMLQTLRSGNVGAIEDEIRGFFGTQQGARLFQNLRSNVNPITDESTKRRMDMFDAFWEMQGQGVSRREMKSQLSQWFEQAEVTDFFKALEQPDKFTQWLGRWIDDEDDPESEVPSPAFTANTTTQRMVQKAGMKGRRRAKKLKTYFPGVTYRSVLEDYIGAPRGRGKRGKLTRAQREQHGALRTDFMMMYGLGGNDFESSMFFGATDKETGKRMRATGSELVRQISGLKGTGMMSGDFDEGAVSRWKEAVSLDQKLGFEIQQAEKKIRRFRGEKSVQTILNQLTTPMKTDVGEVKRILMQGWNQGDETQLTESQKIVLGSRVMSKRAEVMLSGVNTYGGLMSFLSETVDKGKLWDLTQAQLRNTIPEEQGFLKLLGDTYQEAKDTSIEFLQALKEQMVKEASDPENNFYNIKSMIEDLKFHNEATLNMSIGTHLQVWFPLNTG